MILDEIMEHGRGILLCVCVRICTCIKTLEGFLDRDCLNRINVQILSSHVSSHNPGLLKRTLQRPGPWLSVVFPHSLSQPETLQPLYKEIEDYFYMPLTGHITLVCLLQG